MISNDGYLAAATQCPSPNTNQRPVDHSVSLLVIHNISLPPGQFGTGCVQSFFTNQLDPAQHPYFQTIAELKVSAHLFIERDGTVTQFVPFGERAWHAGASSFHGVANCNDYSIGIELEGCDNIAYTDAQYEALAEVSREILRAYPEITLERIVGHNDIAPGRKTDPGEAFDWPRFRASLNTR
ncbi:N-acetyl-anhydromuranmyl-L-alanine amidase [Cellvibrio zantedeschiae]|uniref:1,6-anhydro-N-acetylmuramyl-L-alanine amidase AmpD n=1 Tax=Cellvibrio zantedeschiae TaxID=1237077 RepID=A0ABQ3APY8_9GAMM|nr:1,6-anhydro-N-acetylmuramyl-L-alanine amidase AmpD [Cellvibrio zantedeschiae]GGY62985.1 N-acetyl-anhydromuranmyl-L-alanine amidase [Cellvibrio zantedeschiae]